MSINYTRLVNVLAQEPIKALLIERGATLSRNDLDTGKKADADLNFAIAEMYNDETNGDLNQLHWEVDWKKDPDPSNFDVIDSEKAKSSLSLLARTYEKAYQAWKTSGFNRPMGEAPLPFSRFGNGWVLYLHEMVSPHDDLLKAVFQELPEGVFAESGSKKNRLNRRSRQSSSGGDEAIAVLAQASVKRSAAFEYGIINNAIVQTKQEISAIKEKKKEAICKLKNHPKVQSGTKVKSVVQYVDAKRKAANKGDTLTFDDYEGEWPFSQLSASSYDTRVLDASDIVDFDSELEKAKMKLAEQEETIEHVSKKLKTGDDN